MTSTDSCLLSIHWWALCMSKAEWAGWVQAIGAIVAIAGSAWVVRWQMAAAAREATRQAHQQQIQWAQGLVFILAPGAATMAELVKESPAGWIQRGKPVLYPHLTALRGVASSLSRIDLMQFRSAELVSLYADADAAVRGVCAELEMLVRNKGDDLKDALLLALPFDKPQAQLVSCIDKINVLIGLMNELTQR